MTQLPLTFLRSNIYTDPVKPVAVEPGLMKFGDAGPDSPVMYTTNFALTFFTVESDIKQGGVDAWLVVVDTEGMSVQSNSLIEVSSTSHKSRYINIG